MGDTAAFTVTKENVEDDRALLQVKTVHQTLASMSRTSTTKYAIQNL